VTLLSPSVGFGRFEWWSELLSRPRQAFALTADDRVPPPARLTFQGWCLIHTSDVWKRLNDGVVDLHRRRLITERQALAQFRRRDAWHAVERRSPYTAGVRPAFERRRS
jgi:hypothetical protein